MVNDRLDELLQQHGARLVAYVRKHGHSLLAYETVDDLVQGVILRAIEQRQHFEYRSEPEFLAWLFAIGKGHLADRHQYWLASKRRAGRVLRYTLTQGSSDGVPLPAATRTGPGSFAERREMLEVATRALAALPDRDRQLVQMSSEQVPLDEQAARLGISYANAQRASLRARERFRKTFELLLRR